MTPRYWDLSSLLSLSPLSLAKATRGKAGAKIFSPGTKPAPSPWSKTENKPAAGANGNSGGGGGGGSGGGGGGGVNAPPAAGLTAAQKGALLKRMIMVSSAFHGF